MTCKDSALEELTISAKVYGFGNSVNSIKELVLNLIPHLKQ